jgi:peptidoglycan L-alanyl-D-glutamate endopeptidase CwlK
MPYFSQRSLDNLAGCHPELQRLAHELIKVIDFTVLCGHRGEQEQNEAFNAVPQRSKTPWPKSKHNPEPSLAFDLSPVPVRWDDTKENWMRWCFFAGMVVATAASLKIKVRSGLDWNQNFDPGDEKFKDAPHFEIILDA